MFIDTKIIDIITVPYVVDWYGVSRFRLLFLSTSTKHIPCHYLIHRIGATVHYCRAQFIFLNKKSWSVIVMDIRQWKKTQTLKGQQDHRRSKDSSFVEVKAGISTIYPPTFIQVCSIILLNELCFQVCHTTVERALVWYL
jgi:hypothetical protein